MLSWTETLKQVQGGSSFWQLTSANGTVQFTNTGDTSDNCDATLSPNPAIAGNVTEFAPQIVQGAISVSVSAEPPTYWSGQASTAPDPLLSSDALDPGCYFSNNTAYASGFWTSFTGSECHYTDGGGEAMVFPLDATSTVYDNCSAQGSDAQGDTGTATLTSQLTLTPPGLCPPPPSLRHVAASRNGPAAPIARPASGGLLTATVTGVPRGFRGALTVLAIAADDGEVIAGQSLLAGTTRTSFRLPSGRVAILANAVSASARRHNVTGIGPLISLRARGAVKSAVALGRLGAADQPASKPSARAAAVAAAAAAGA
ncbi:MAG TPA: hypothetical protein VMA96_01065, partial [Solirubrobacteraceae bacterium]|nr:hypothetical protein [Solirubrobacteraceae bacterium]